MELRKEYAGIVDAHVGGLSDIACERIELVALACQKLADRPPRELTDAEIAECWTNLKAQFNFDTVRNQFARAIIAAHIAKQSEREPRKFRAAMRWCGEVGVFEKLPDSNWQWLDADGQPQEIKVRL